MCSRYTLKLDGTDLVKLFELDDREEPPIPEWSPRFNIAPTDQIPIYVETAKDGSVAQRLELARWGLLFSGKQSPRPLINTRVESLEGGGSMAGVFAKRRALIPADGYFEWRAATDTGGSKQPYYFHSVAPLVFAGLYQWSKGANDEWVLSASIITRPPTERAAQIHDRMPLVLPRSFWGDWVNPLAEGSRVLAEAALAASDEVALVLDQYPVSKAIGSVKADGPQLIEPIPDPSASD